MIFEDTYIMKAEGYQKSLQGAHLLFLWHVYPAGHYLKQDNDPKHTVVKCLIEEGVS